MNVLTLTGAVSALSLIRLEPDFLCISQRGVRADRDRLSGFIVVVAQTKKSVDATRFSQLF